MGSIQNVPQRPKRKRKTLEQLVDVDQRKFRENKTSILTPKELVEVPVSPGSMPTDVTASSSTPSRTFATDVNTIAHLPRAEEHYITFENQQSHKVTKIDVPHLPSTVIPSDSHVNTECTPSRNEAVAKSVQTGTLTSDPVEQEGARRGDAVQSNKDDPIDVDVIDEQLIAGRTLLGGDEMELEHKSPVQGQVVEKLQEIHDRLSQYVPLPYEDLSSAISTSVDEEDGVSENTKTVDRQVIFQSEQDPKAEHIETEETIRQEKEDVPGPDMNSLSLVHPSLLMAKVPTLVRGLSNPGKVAISFEIEHGAYAALSRWTRHDSTQFTDAICITLGCYQATEAALKAVASKSERDWWSFVSASQSSWPGTGGLQLSFTAENGWNLPLAPPFLVTPDNLFDLSRLLVLGTNEFDLQFTQDMSKYLFALVIPLPHQLNWQGEPISSKRSRAGKTGYITCLNLFMSLEATSFQAK